MQTIFRNSIAISSCCLTLFACGGNGTGEYTGNEGVFEGRGGTSSSGSEGKNSPDGLAPVEIVDGKGQRWVRTRTATVVPDSAPRRRPSRDSKTPEDMTDEDLAKLLRPISMYNGYEYTVADLPLETARAIKARRRLTTSGIQEDTGTPKPGSHTCVDDTCEEQLQEQAIIGSDGRVVKRNNQDWPWRSMIVLTNQAMTFRCSAQLIGPSTAVSAAHCFHDGNNWFDTRKWSTGADSQDAIVYPDGLANGCYWVSIPGGYASSDGEFTYDYAVIEFSNMFPTCNLYPGNWAGWLGWWARPPTSLIQSTYGYVYGYPADKPWPQIWGIGTNNMDVDGSDEIEHYADTYGGQSGAGLYIIDNGNRYVVGAHQGWDDPDIGSIRNRARRIDGSFESLIYNRSAQ